MQNTAAGEVDFEPRYVEPPQLLSQFASVFNSAAAEVLHCDLFSTCSSFKAFTLELPWGTQKNYSFTAVANMSEKEM